MSKNQDVRNFEHKLRTHGIVGTRRHTTTGLKLVLGEIGSVFISEDTKLLTIGLGSKQNEDWIKLVRIGLGSGYDFVDNETGRKLDGSDVGWLLQAAQKRAGIKMFKLKRVA